MIDKQMFVIYYNFRTSVRNICIDLIDAVNYGFLMGGSKMRRSREVRNNLSLSVVVFSLVLVVVVILITSHAMISKAKEQYAVEKFYQSYEVQDGDNLWDIAADYYNVECGTTSEYIDEIKSMNHLSDDTIHAGEHIVIPYYVIQQ
jgi:hypothetical protein